MTGPPISRKERQEETRRRLLGAAAKVFTERGYHGASVSAIAAEAGYTTGALYANYAGKEDLFLALLDTHVSAQIADAEALIGDELPDAYHLAARVERAVAALGASGADSDGSAADRPGLGAAAAQVLTLEFLLYAVRERPDLRAELAHRYRAVDARVTELIERWLASRGRTSTIEPEDLALVHSWLVEGLALRVLVDPELTDPGRAADLYRRIVTELPVSGA